MKLLTQQTIDLGEKNDTRVLIVTEDGKISEPVLRCLGNFKNYAAVGTLVSSEDNKVLTYCLFGTKSLEAEYFTVSHENDAIGNKITQDEIDKKIIIRAKDLMFSLGKG